VGCFGFLKKIAEPRTKIFVAAMLSVAPNPGHIIAITIVLFALHAAPLLFFGRSAVTATSAYNCSHVSLSIGDRCVLGSSESAQLERPHQQTLKR
jgi:hypothetical protein